MSDNQQKGSGPGTRNTSGKQLPLQQVRDRTQAAIARALNDCANVVIISPPGGGKSYGTAIEIAQKRIPAAYFCPTDAIKEQFIADCEEHGLTVQQLPSMPKLCEHYPNFEGSEPTWDQKKSWSEDEKRVYSLYQRGMAPSNIHDDERGHGICPKGTNCEYWEQKPETVGGGKGELAHVPQAYADVLVGDPSHAYVPQWVNKRTVIFDDVEVESFVTNYDEYNKGSPTTAMLNAVLSDDEFPMSSKSELTSAKGEDNAEAIAALDGMTVEPWGDETTVSDVELLVRTYLAAEDLGNGVHHLQTDIPGIFEDRMTVDCVIDEDDDVHILQRPELRQARNVIVLDGTPLPGWYEYTLDVSRLDTVEVLGKLGNGLYHRFIHRGKVVQTADWMHPVSGHGTSQVSAHDEDRLNEITRRYGPFDALVSSKKALREIERAGLTIVKGGMGSFQNRTMNFAQVASSRKFEAAETALVYGSPHYGDEYVKRIAGLMGYATEANRENGERRYTRMGQPIANHMVNSSVLQAIYRIGRNEDVEPVVVVDTAAIPDDIHIEKDIIRGPTSADPVMWYLEGMGTFNETIGDTRAIPTTQIIDAIQSRYDYTESTIRKRLQSLADAGTVEKKRLSGRGGPVAWESMQV